MIGENLNSGLIFIIGGVGTVLWYFMKRDQDTTKENIDKREDEIKALRLATQLECDKMREEYLAAVKDLTHEYRSENKSLWEETGKLKTNFTTRFEAVHKSISDNTQLILKEIHALDKKIK